MGVITLTTGEKITVTNGVMNVPNNPIIPFIEGDGIVLIFGHLHLAY